MGVSGWLTGTRWTSCDLSCNCVGATGRSAFSFCSYVSDGVSPCFLRGTVERCAAMTVLLCGGGTMGRRGFLFLAC